MASQRPSLHVEGKDDYHALFHFLATRQLNTTGSWFPEIKRADSVEKLLDSIEIAVRFGTGQTIGFVLDADASPNDRWRAVASRLTNVGLTPPGNLPATGYIEFSEQYRTHTGVWLMPNSSRKGPLEDFLIDLIPPADSLLLHAQHATNQGAAFSIHTARKAELRTWLAWCEEPGLPYGSAINVFHLRQRHKRESAACRKTGLQATSGTRPGGCSSVRLPGDDPINLTGRLDKLIGLLCKRVPSQLG